MIINRCVEQGIYVTLILALEHEHKPLRSRVLSSILSVSDSYLKKILRKLVIAGIIVSSPGKDGGFQLSRSVEEISVYDVYSALEGESCDIKMSGIGSRIFIYGSNFSDGEKKVVSIFDKANEAFCDELRNLRLSELLNRVNYKYGTIDFESVLKK